MNPEILAISLSSSAVIISVWTFYRLHIKGPDIILRVNEDVELSPCLAIKFPIMFINEGGKPGTLFFGPDYSSPSAYVPQFLSDFGSSARFKFDDMHAPIKIETGDHLSGHIEIRFMNNDDKLEELTQLFKNHKEIEITTRFLVTKKKEIGSKEQALKLKTNVSELNGFIS